MVIPCKARVLVVENDPHTREQLIEILQGSGYRVLAAEGDGMKLQESAKELAISFRPHVVVMDLRLMDHYSDDRSGLELLADKSFSSSRCILYSAYLKQDYRITRLAFRDNHVEDVIGKEQSPQRLIDVIEATARKGCACRGKFEPSWATTAYTPAKVVENLFGGESEIPVDIVHDVIGRLFPKTSKLTRLREAGTLCSMPLTCSSTVMVETPGEMWYLKLQLLLITLTKVTTSSLT